MTKHRLIGLVALALLACVPHASSALEWKAPGPNIALDKPYKLLRKPGYALTTDGGDATQLTDGKFAPTAKAIWYFKQTVGWFGNINPIVIDLGSDQPIAGVGYNTEVGLSSGVGWPPAVLVFVSNDGEAWHYAGDVIALSSKYGIPSDTHGRHFFRTDEMRTHGRYVQVLPLTSVFAFTDEIEVYQGKPEFLKAELPVPVTGDLGNYVYEHKMPYAVAARLATDAQRALRTIQGLKVEARLEQKLTAQLEKLRAAAVTPDLSAKYDIDYHALAPLNPAHAQILAVMSEAYRAAGYPEFTVWHNNRWNRQTPFQPPTALVDGKVPEVKLDVQVLQNDRRGEVLNIGNFTGDARSAVVSISGLPGGAQPQYLRLRNAEYVAMQSRIWDADVLPLAEATGAGWKIDLPAGISRQVWFDFNVDAKDCPPGTHEGNVEIQVQGGPKLSVPIRLTVAPYCLPEASKKAVAVGVWDYTDMGGSGGLINDPSNPHNRNRNKDDFNNLAAVVKHLQESGVTAPWARSDWRNDGTFPRPGRGIDAFDKDGNFTGPLDFSAFDQWIAMWPDAKYYMFHAIAWWQYAGAGKGDWKADPEVERRLGIVMTKWAEHMRSKGIDLNKIVLLLVDEPIHTWQADLTISWARAIKKAVPEFKVYVDPMIRPQSYTDPSYQKMFEYCDIITPGTDYSYQHFGQAAVDFYDRWRKKGKTMGFYACAQNPSEGESIRYFRLQQIACWKISGGAPNSWAGFWAYCDMRGVKPWNQLAGSEKDRSWCQAYVDTKGGTDGKHWLAIFEGANDYEYLLILKNRIAELEKAGKTSDALTAAQKVLAEVPDEIISGVREKNDVNAIDAGRLKVLAALVSLASQP